jgi:hypothetical protein
MSREAIEEAIEVLEDASAEMLMETGDKNYYIEAIAVLRQAIEQAETREWVGLTDEEIHDMNGYEEDRRMYRFARAIEAKLKEKNT